MIREGLARERNLDILMPWVRTLTYWYVDMSDWVPLGCYIGALGGFIGESGYQNIDILMVLAALNHSQSIVNSMFSRYIDILAFWCQNGRFWGVPPVRLKRG